MEKRAVLKVAMKKGAAHRKITMTSKQARITQNLGNGFRRWVFFRTVGPNTIFTFTFNAGSLKVVSGGWWIRGFSSERTAYATANYSQNTNRWIVGLYNGANSSRLAAFTFITKT